MDVKLKRVEKVLSGRGGRKIGGSWWQWVEDSVAVVLYAVQITIDSTKSVVVVSRCLFFFVFLSLFRIVTSFSIPYLCYLSFFSSFCNHPPLKTLKYWGKKVLKSQKKKRSFSKIERMFIVYGWLCVYETLLFKSMYQDRYFC